MHSSIFPDFLNSWINTVYGAIHLTNQKYPYLSYGTDWLAFGHVVIAMAFVGPLNRADPRIIKQAADKSPIACT